MSYDFHDYWPYWPFTGYNAPLYKKEIEDGYFATLNTNWSVLNWQSLGMSKDKIMVGIPTYTHTYTLQDATKHAVFDPAVSSTDWTYPQVCDLLRNSSTGMIFDDEAKVPYCFNDMIWVSYENEESVTYKANWIKDNGFGGAMTFDLNTDDYEYKCTNRTRFILHSIIHSILP